MDRYVSSIRNRASTDTFISLLQLDPAPMESPTFGPGSDKDLPPLPEESIDDLASSRTSMQSSGTLGLGKGPIFYLSRIQRYSSYTLTFFTSLHLATTSLIPLVNSSVEASESALLLAREIYQTPTTEPLLIGLPLIAHVGSGLAMRLIRRSQNIRRYGSGATPGLWAQHHKRESSLSSSSSRSNRHRGVVIWPKLSWISASGYAFAGFLAAHVAINRVLPLVVEGDSSSVGLSFVAHGFARHGTVARVAYVGLIGIGCGHMVWGWAKWVGLTPPPLQHGAVLDKKERRRRRRMWLGVHAVALATAGLWAAGGLGVVAKGGASPGWVGELYDGMFARVWM